VGRAKLEDDKKRRRYTFYLTPAAAAVVEAIAAGERGRVISKVIEQARELVALLAAKEPEDEPPAPQPARKRGGR